MFSLHETTNEALRQWIVVTGVDPELKREGWNIVVGHNDSGFQQYEISQINKYIVEAQDIDPSGLTAFMVVRAVAHQYIQSHKFNALSLLEEDERTIRRVEELRKLKKLVDHPEALLLVEAFQNTLQEAAIHYGVADKVADLLKDPNALSHIRRDALISTTMLERHTFAKGARAVAKLRYNPVIIKMWNMNSLVRMAELQPENGISIVMVRDPVFVAYSFFCFLIRDGENITIWTDIDRPVHPMHKSMSRGRAQARSLRDRSAKLRFPYQLLDATFSEDDKHVWDAQSTALVRTNTQAIPISTIENMNPDQILWAILALDVLVKEDHAPKLSVTGESLTFQLSPGTLRVLPEHTAVPLTVNEVNGKAIGKQLRELEGHRSTRINAWMEDRYAASIDPRLYNMAGELPPPKSGHEAFWEQKPPQTREMVLLGGEKIDALTLLPQARGVADKGRWKTRAPTLIGLDPVAFGTPEMMEADRLWIARWNQAQAIGQAAVAEFDARREDVIAWYTEKVTPRLEFLLGQAAQGSWEVETNIIRGVHAFGQQKGGYENLIRWYRACDGSLPLNHRDPWPSRDRKDTFVSLIGNFERYLTSRASEGPCPLRCVVTGMAANHWIMFRPQTPEGIAALAGVTVEELPELLEHWNPTPPYDGNSILDRTDPLDSQIGNPWNVLTFSVLIGVSKRAWNRFVKACPNPGKITWREKDPKHGWD